MKYQIQDLLNSITTHHVALAPAIKGNGWRIIKYNRTANGIETETLKSGSLELMLDYAEHLTAELNG